MSMIVVLKGLISEFDVSVKKNIAVLRADNSSRYQPSSHTAARSHHVPLAAGFLWLGVSAHHTYWSYHDVCIMPYILFKIILHAFAP